MTDVSYLLSDDSDVMVAEVFGEGGGAPGELARGESVEDVARGMWYGHSSLMGWGHPPQDSPRSLWRFHEFGCVMTSDPADCQAWAQVGVDIQREYAAGEVAPSLPVAPLLVSLADTITQLGDASFEGAQIVLPLRFQPIGATVAGDASRWFEHRPTTERVVIDVMVNFGHHAPPSPRDAVDDSLDGVISACPTVAVDLDPWPQSAWIRANRVPKYSLANTLRWSIEFSQWSVMAAAWLVSMVTEVLARHGVRHPIVVSIKPVR